MAQIWHVGTSSWKIGTPLARWGVYWHVGTWADGPRWYAWHAFNSTFKRNRWFLKICKIFDKLLRPKITELLPQYGRKRLATKIFNFVKKEKLNTRQMDHAGTHDTHLTLLLKETDGFLNYVKFLINYWGRKLGNCYLNTEEKDQSLICLTLLKKKSLILDLITTFGSAVCGILLY